MAIRAGGPDEDTVPQAQVRPPGTLIWNMQ